MYYWEGRCWLTVQEMIDDNILYNSEEIGIQFKGVNY